MFASPMLKAGFYHATRQVTAMRHIHSGPGIGGLANGIHKHGGHHHDHDHTLCAFCGNKAFSPSCCFFGTESVGEQMAKAKKLRSQVAEYINEETLSHVHDVFGTRHDLEDVIAQNNEWRHDMNKRHPEYFPRISKMQDPKYLMIGCVDARANPNQIMGFEKDEVFVTRNICNQVAPGDMNVLSVLEFSLGVLRIPHVIVMGHTECGAIKGALAKQTNGGLGFLENWLRHIRDVADKYKPELDALEGKAKENRLAVLNVKEQVKNLYKTGIVQKRRAETPEQSGSELRLPIIHGLLYDVADGSITKVHVDRDEVEDLACFHDTWQKGFTNDLVHDI